MKVTCIFRRLKRPAAERSAASALDERGFLESKFPGGDRNGNDEGNVGGELVPSCSWNPTPSFCLPGRRLSAKDEQSRCSVCVLSQQHGDQPLPMLPVDLSTTGKPMKVSHSNCIYGWFAEIYILEPGRSSVARTPPPTIQKNQMALKVTGTVSDTLGLCCLHRKLAFSAIGE